MAGVRQMLAAPPDAFDSTLGGLFAGEPPAEFLSLLGEMASDVRPEACGLRCV